MSADPEAKEQTAKENRKATRIIRITASHRGSLIIKVAMGMKQRVLPNTKDDIANDATRHTRVTAGRFAMIVVYAIVRSRDVEGLEDDRMITHDVAIHLILEDVVSDTMITRDEVIHQGLKDDVSNRMTSRNENTHLIQEDDSRVRTNPHGRQRMYLITIM